MRHFGEFFAGARTLLSCHLEEASADSSADEPKYVMGMALVSVSGAQSVDVPEDMRVPMQVR